MKKKGLIILLTFVVIVAFLGVTQVFAEDENITIKFNDEKLFSRVLWNSGLERITHDVENKTITCTQAEINKIISLDLSNQGITDLTGLEKFTRLYTLNLSGNDLSKTNATSALENITIMEHLNLENTGISNISFLAKLTNLVDLNITENNITDISPVSEMTKLFTLKAGKNKITDISKLAKLVNLQSLWMYENDITDISVVAGMKGLKYFSISGCKVTDISALKGFTTLEQVNLTGNKIKDATILNTNHKMTQLYLGYTGISEINEVIKYMTELTNLDFQGNSVSDISNMKNLKKLKSSIIDYNCIADITPLEKLNMDRLVVDHQTITLKGKKGETINLPKIFSSAKSASSIAYTSTDLKTKNCKLDSTGAKVTLKSNPASVTIKNGLLFDSVVNIEVDETATVKTTKKKEETKPKTLPKTGASIAVISALGVLVAIAGYTYYKNKKYTGI